ncbi:MAG: hypothetical protein H8D56_13000 [Planctomycetes bacterium]|nr:hypothetical protein [Planctomycetota bacterium]MBL7145482.1 hypothetical protein [Phycisphaerae bacterium]
MSDAQIFQIISIVYIAVGIGIFINPGFYKKLFEDFIENAAVMYLGGVMALTIGYLILVFHNTWTKDLSVIITIVGWLALIKGILILIRPKIVIALSRAMVQKEGILKIEAIAVIILGLAFAFLGFCPKSPI